MLRARANGETFVSATRCLRLPGPLLQVHCYNQTHGIIRVPSLDFQRTKTVRALQSAMDCHPIGKGGGVEWSSNTRGGTEVCTHRYFQYIGNQSFGYT